MAMIMGSLVPEPLLFIWRIWKTNSTRSPAHYTHMNEEKGKTYNVHEAQGLITQKKYASTTWLLLGAESLQILLPQQDSGGSSDLCCTMIQTMMTMVAYILYEI